MKLYDLTTAGGRIKGIGIAIPNTDHSSPAMLYMKYILLGQYAVAEGWWTSGHFSLIENPTDEEKEIGLRLCKTIL